MKNIVIINQPLNNRGDEAAHRSLIRTINKNLTDFNVTVLFLDCQKDSIEQISVKSDKNKYVNITAIRGAKGLIPKILIKLKLDSFAPLFPFYNKYIQIIKQADVIINAPGGICMGGFKNWGHIFNLALALKYNSNVFYYSRSIGPFNENSWENKIFKNKSIELMRKLKFFSIRDFKSMEIAKELGINYTNSIDTAFLDNYESTHNQSLQDITLKEDYIVMVPNSLTWHPDFKGIEQDLIDRLYLAIFDFINNKFPKHKIVLLPQLFNTTNERSDYQYFKKLEKVSSNNNILTLPDTITSDQQQFVIEKSKLIIGARYHSIVFAINNQTPLLSLSYEHKMSGLLDLLDISKCNIDFKKLVLELKKENIVSCINILLENINNALEFSNKYKKEESTIKAQKLARNCFDKMQTQLRQTLTNKI